MVADMYTKSLSGGLYLNFGMITMGTLIPTHLEPGFLDRSALNKVKQHGVERTIKNTKQKTITSKKPCSSATISCNIRMKDKTGKTHSKSSQNKPGRWNKNQSKNSLYTTASTGRY